MTNQRIGSFIGALRKERGLTQEQLAEKLGVTNRSISRWENGNTLPDFSLMQELSLVLDVRLSELLAGQRTEGAERPEACIALAMELAQREAEQRRKQLNLRFGCGFAFLLTAALRSSLPFLSAPAFWVCIGLGIAFMLAGFYRSNAIRPISKGEIAVMAAPESNLRMKTAEEMLQFSKKHQTGHRKQHTRAFTEIASQLASDEYALFTFIGDSCTINDSPGPWHISIAVTNKRFLLSGESVRGRILTTFLTDSYARSALRTTKLSGHTLILIFDDTTIKVDGSRLDTIIGKLQRLS